MTIRNFIALLLPGTPLLYVIYTLCLLHQIVEPIAEGIVL